MELIDCLALPCWRPLDLMLVRYASPVHVRPDPSPAPLISTNITKELDNHMVPKVLALSSAFVICVINTISVNVRGQSSARGIRH